MPQEHKHWHLRVKGDLLSDVDVPARIADDITVTAVAKGTDLNANGVDQAKIETTLTDGAKRPVPGRSVLFTLNKRGWRSFDDEIGTLTPASATTDSTGTVIAEYTAPALSFVPEGATVVVTATVADPSVEFPPSGTVTLTLAREGSEPLLTPKMTGVVPDTARVDKPTTVLVQGDNFVDGAVVMLAGETLNPPAILAPEPSTSMKTLVVETPRLSKDNAGIVNLFVVNPGGLSSNAVKFTLTRP